MKIGHMPSPHGGPYEQPEEPSPQATVAFCGQLLNEGIEVEKAGCDSVFLPERHHRTGTIFAPPLTMLAGYATRTKRVDLGTFVLRPPYYNRLPLAEDVAMSALMSKGRLSVGLGHHPSSFHLSNVPCTRHFSRFEESQELLRQARTSPQPFSYHGKRFQFDNTIPTPKPYRPGGPPRWGGAAYTGAIEQAGEPGDGWDTLLFWGPVTKLRERARLDRESTAAYQRQPKGVFMQDGWVAPSRREAEDVFGPLWVQEIFSIFSLESAVSKRRVPIRGGFHD